MKMIVRLAALSGALSVMAGAFGTHAAHGQAAELFRVGGEYEMVHAVAALVATRLARRSLPAWLLLGGSLLFACSLYALALGAPNVTGIVTPIGGAGMIVGWIALAFLAFPGAQQSPE